MFGLSFGEILVILVVALLVLGPERLPKVARTVGKGMRELRRATGDFREVVESEFYLDDDEASRHKPRIEAAATVAKGEARAAPAQPVDAEAQTAEAPAEAAAAGETETATEAPAGLAAAEPTQAVAQGDSPESPSPGGPSPESPEELPTIRPPADGPVMRGTKA